MNFLKRSHVKSVNINRISRDETPSHELWKPYPRKDTPRQSNLSWYFDEACKLSYIARDASWNLPQPDDGSIKRQLYKRLCEWERNLPSTLMLKDKPAPYILVLRFVITSSFQRSLQRQPS